MERIGSATTAFESDSSSQRSLVPPTWESTARSIGKNEVAAAGISLAHSFAADPLSRYLLDGRDMGGCSPEAIWKLHVSLMTTVVATHSLKGVVTTTGPDYDGLAVWELPGSKTDGLLTMLRSGMLKLYLDLSAESRERYFKETLPLLHRTKTEVMRERDDDSYYLVYIGTKPTARGRGYATRLLKDMIRKADLENRYVYLESSSPENNSFYQRFGFKVKKQISFGRGDTKESVKLDIMVREPQTRKAANSSPATSESSSLDD